MSITSDELLALFMVLIGIPLVVFLVIILPILIVNNKYKNFILLHSDAIKKLKTINDKYKFYKIENYDMSHSYDNEKFYDNISCEDYLIYQLVFISKKVINTINNALSNKLSYESYINEINKECILDVYDTSELLRNRNKLRRMEKNIIKDNTRHPVTKFNINVKLIRTNINGDRKDSKSVTFPSEYIRTLIDRVNNKRGNRYLDEEIWNSICRVERGKVTNKMRFAIYNRDGYRCRICGKKKPDLEIDHIYPISKGGKSTMDNLQTLCHSCNVKKGADII